MNFEGKKYLEKALLEREPVFKEAVKTGTNCFRLFNGFVEGIPGLIIEQYDQVLVFQLHEPDCRLTEEQLIELAEWLFGVRGAKSAFKKIFIQDRSNQVAHKEYYSPVPFAGIPCSETVPVQENGSRFLIQPFSGYSAGLFLDQRNNRLFLSKDCYQKRVLNLFSYTCAFSVMCAQGSARTTSVDLSAKYLDWGKKNFELNGLSLSEHSFIVSDVFDYLRKVTKRSEKFDLVIADPPSFSRSKKGGVFSLKRDFAKLLESIAPIVSVSGNWFFSCNLSEWTTSELKKKAQPILAKYGHWEWNETPACPKDFKNGKSHLSQMLVTKLK
ncbi:MAG: class I SAM-dependent rRNA methyltransferase [Proteobacteria bacterium]|nr:class I SAM-dependent rRNA methyltransferase [Pseudomonadota bacterium]NDC24756.1 class I SAM-dependent rRNA methyltransferase [Pseudomonadota bacterium]NDD03283.1 class I SAM-dependent rRNA methyltransferase [Pseudomonadota bacterium]NDG25970.1 class I SAM-dependent rRNA methyltransferase [Pseudomonadota bacterium]